MYIDWFYLSVTVICSHLQPVFTFATFKMLCWTCLCFLCWKNYNFPDRILCILCVFLVQYDDIVCQSEKIIVWSDRWCCAEKKDTKHWHVKHFLKWYIKANSNICKNGQNSPRLLAHTAKLHLQLYYVR